MIEFNLFEFFGILGVGTFTVLSIVYFIFEFQRLFFTKKHNENTFLKWLNEVLKSNHKDTLLTVVAAIVVYSAGLLIQDITDKLTDTADDTSLVKNVLIIKNLLPNEGELRIDALVKDGNNLTHLGAEVFDSAHKILVKQKNQLGFFETPEANKYWRRNGRSIKDSINKWISNPKSAEKPKFVDFVNGIYYTAKNWCYLRSDTIKRELEKIQERIDFSRSLLLLAYLDALFLVALFCIYYLRELLYKGPQKWFTVCNPGIFSIPYKKVFYPWYILIFVPLIWVAGVGYRSAEKNFNERAMGYYVSQFKYADEKKE